VQGALLSLRLPAAANLTAKCRPRPPAFSTAQRRSGNRFAQLSRTLKPVRSCGKLVRSTSSPVAWSTTATATDALWGSTPIKTFMRAYLRFGRTPAIGTREGHSDFVPCTHLFRATPHAVLYGGTQAENRPARLRGDRKFASDP
jgi:hypothetical protein